MRKNMMRVLLVALSVSFSRALSVAPNLQGAKLFNKSGKEVAVDSLRGSSVALYFAGQWCPMCTNFTPHLKEFYSANAVCSKTGVQKAHIIFISSDFDKAAAMSHFASHGDWLMLDYDSALRNDLKRHYRVWGGAETQAE